MHLELESVLWNALQLARKAGDEFVSYLLMMALLELRSREDDDAAAEAQNAPVTD